MSEIVSPTPTGTSLLDVRPIGDGRFEAPRPNERAEDRNVVYSGQLVAQALMASQLACAGVKVPRSIHAVFARPGSYDAPIELTVQSMHAGRSWASDTVTATQDGQLLCRALVLLHAADADLVRHQVAMPDVPGPDEVGHVLLSTLTFPGAEVRPVPHHPDAPGALHLWHRYPTRVQSEAANLALLAWATPGEHIRLALQDAGDVDIDDAHVTISTGVIAHTVHFLAPVDVTEWILLSHEATHAGAGRVHGRGLAFTADGTLVATFDQDAMARAASGPLDPKTSM